MLVDASKLGEKVKEGKNQKTVLRAEEVTLIEKTFINQDVVPDFSVKVTYEQVENKNFSFAAGQYFEIKITVVNLSQEEFEQKIADFSTKLDGLFSNSKNLEEAIRKGMEGLKYADN